MSDAGEPGRHIARRLYPTLGDCEDCGAPATDRHHVDGDTFNNAPENIEQLCRRCHMRKDGRMAALAAHKTPRTPPRPCSNCHRPSKPLRKGRCGTCNEYLRRTGEERPVDADGNPLVRRFVGRVAA